MIEKRVETKCRQEGLNGSTLNQIFFNGIVPGGGCRFFEYNPETKRQSEECHTPQSPRQKKARMSK
jgi:hypothetical protein